MMRSITIAASCASFASVGNATELSVPTDMGCLGFDELFEHDLGDRFRDSMIYSEGFCPQGSSPVWHIIDCETGNVADIQLTKLTAPYGVYDLKALHALRNEIRSEEPIPSLSQIADRTKDLAGNVNWRQLQNILICDNLLSKKPE